MRASSRRLLLHFKHPRQPSPIRNLPSSFALSARRDNGRRSIRRRAIRPSHKRKIHPHHCRRRRTPKTFWRASSTRNAGIWSLPSWKNAPRPRCPARNCRNEIRRLAWRNNKPDRQKLKRSRTGIRRVVAGQKNCRLVQNLKCLLTGGPTARSHTSLGHRPRNSTHLT